MRKQKQKGFTLLEVMVVVVILGIMAAMVVPNLLGNVDVADQNKAVTDISQIETTLERYRMDNRVYPSVDQGLDALTAKPTSGPEPRNYPSEPYLRRLPNDPWGNPYVYVYPGEKNANSYDVYTLGADGQEGGEGINADIGNWNLQDFL
uniref:type II secretion system major pseudopilin GspG n=1 Tax=Thaumasiovibrio occultus TaxID=1891184 RepID=UPI000B34C7E0|nr:type II secretion system major pseudopilin GspG [Thaumasiovibrio occultus]